jgi:two-component system sensor histidine kinase ChvG
MAWLRLGLRAKLALAGLTVLVLPLAGVLYVNEMERLLLEGQTQVLLATARAVATALHERPQLLTAVPEHDDLLRREAEAELRRLTGAVDDGSTDTPSPVALAREAALKAQRAQADIAAILRGLQRTTSRIWVVNRRLQVLALAGSLKRDVVAAQPPEGWRAAWQRVAGWIIQRPTEEFAVSLPDDVLATGRDISAALQGTPSVRTRRTPDGLALVVSAAHPIWNGDEVAGAVVVEETTNPIASLRSEALERLLLFTLIAFVAAGALLIGYASRLSHRIRMLRDEAESAIDARGRISRLATGSQAGDEIGDLSRSFSEMLARLAQHHAYLESMAGRLSHELRTPIAVVRSSLENLDLSPTPEEAKRYLARAEEGLARLTMILQRMTEASRLEQSLRTAEREAYDLVPVVRGCVEGYRLAYPAAAFELEVPESAVSVAGSPDLAAQLLDKLIENAVDFAREGTPVRIALEPRERTAILSVANRGPVLPKSMRGRLFESMVSVRDAQGSKGPHLGLGLYVARLIAEFHGGSIEARNLPGGEGVVVRARFARAAGEMETRKG